MKNEKKYPRRFGIAKVREEIQQQGGEPTLRQQAMIASNHLKNMNVKINNLLIKDFVNDEKQISETELSFIISTVETIEKQLKQILKKK